MENSISNMRPELVKEWSEKNYPLTPDCVPFGSNKLYWWRGSCGHEWQTSAKARSYGEGCPICSNARIVPGINDLQTLEPELSKEWSRKNSPLLPTMVGPGSHRKVIWKGKCGHEWSAVIKNRVAGAGCPYCSHNKVLAGFNDLETLYPEVAKEWSERNFPLLPSQVTAFANKKVWWKCSEGHEWFTLISTRSSGSKCPYCSGLKLLKGFNDLATTHPDLALEWSERNGDLHPDMVNDKSTKSVWWKCHVCGYEWKQQIKTRVNGGECPSCSNRCAITGYNDLASTEPELMKEWDYSKNKIDPTKILRTAYNRAWWKCEFGHSWNAPICDRTLGDCSCKECESEFIASLPQLLTMYYARENNLNVVLRTTDAIGLPVDAFIPYFNLVVDGFEHSRKIKAVKKSLTLSPVGTKFDRSSEAITEETGDSRNQIHRYIRLTNLVQELLDLVDEGKIKMRPAVELSYLDEDSQRAVVDEIDLNQCTPSHDQTIRMRKFFTEGKLTPEVVSAIMSEEKPNQREKIVLRGDKVRSLIPKNIPVSQTEDYVVKALEHYSRFLRQRAERDSR